VDIEHLEWQGISVFIGLNGISADSSLDVIDGSHRWDRTPQQMGITFDDGLARAGIPASSVSRVALSEGEFFLFHWRLWFCSCNRSNRTRLELLLQYARPESVIKIPITWDPPIQWHPYPPPCVLISGKDSRHLNKLVDRVQSIR